METKAAVDILAALAQESRLNIFRLLVAAGPDGLTPGAIAEQLEMANATLSFHLKELSRASLVGVRQDGRFLYYSANYATMEVLQGFLTDNCCQGKPCGIKPATASKAKTTRKPAPRKKARSIR